MVLFNAVAGGSAQANRKTPVSLISNGISADNSNMSSFEGAEVNRYLMMMRNKCGVQSDSSMMIHQPIANRLSVKYRLGSRDHPKFRLGKKNPTANKYLRQWRADIGKIDAKQLNKRALRFDGQKSAAINFERVENVSHNFSGNL